MGSQNSRLPTNLARAAAGLGVAELQAERREHLSAGRNVAECASAAGGGEMYSCTQPASKNCIRQKCLTGNFRT